MKWIIQGTAIFLVAKLKPSQAVSSYFFWNQATTNMYCVEKQSGNTNYPTSFVPTSDLDAVDQSQVLPETIYRTQKTSTLQANQGCLARTDVQCNSNELEMVVKSGSSTGSNYEYHIYPCTITPAYSCFFNDGFCVEKDSGNQNFPTSLSHTDGTIVTGGKSITQEYSFTRGDCGLTTVQGTRCADRADVSKCANVVTVIETSGSTGSDHFYNVVQCQENLCSTPYSGTADIFRSGDGSQTMCVEKLGGNANFPQDLNANDKDPEPVSVNTFLGVLTGYPTVLKETITRSDGSLKDTSGVCCQDRTNLPSPMKKCSPVGQVKKAGSSTGSGYSYNVYDCKSGTLIDLNDSYERSLMMELSRLGVIVETYTYYGSTAYDSKDLFVTNLSFATATTGRNTAAIGRKLMPNGREYCIMGFNGADWDDSAEVDDYRTGGKYKSRYREYHGVYVNREIKSQLQGAEDDIIELLSGCYQGCMDKDTCELVLTGHSAGGGKAIVVPNLIQAHATDAGLPTRWYEEPLIITFGGLRPLKEGQKGNSVVTNLDDRVFNFIRAMHEWDFVPYLYTGVTDTIGTPIMFPGGSDKKNGVKNMKWYSNGDTTNRATLYGSYHKNSEYYFDELKDLDTDGVSLNGYIEGVRCGGDSLCRNTCDFFHWCT